MVSLGGGFATFWGGNFLADGTAAFGLSGDKFLVSLGVWGFDPIYNYRNQKKGKLLVYFWYFLILHLLFIIHLNWFSNTNLKFSKNFYNFFQKLILPFCELQDQEHFFEY